MQKIRLVFSCIERGNFNGAPKNIYRLIEGINRERIEPVLISTSENILTNKLSKIGIRVIIVPIPNEINVYEKKLLKFSFSNFIKILKGIYKYQKSLAIIIKDLNVDVFWCENIRNLIMSFYILRKSKIKIIWNVWSEGTNRIISKLIHLFGLFIADEINFEYFGQKNKIFGFMGNGIKLFKKNVFTVLYSGVTNFEDITGSNIRKELGINKTDVILLMASDIYLPKGQYDLLQTFKIILKHTNKLHLLLAGRPQIGLVGSQNYYNDIKEYINTYKLYNNVHLLGWRDDMPDLFYHSDIYVSTSYGEGLPDSVREAMKYSKPVVATDVGGTSELITNDLNGYLFEPGDCESLSELLLKLIENEPLRKKMGISGKRIINEKFSNKAYVLKFEKMIIDCVNRNSKHHLNS